MVTRQPPFFRPILSPRRPACDSERPPRGEVTLGPVVRAVLSVSDRAGPALTEAGNRREGSLHLDAVEARDGGGSRGVRVLVDGRRGGQAARDGLEPLAQLVRAPHGVGAVRRRRPAKATFTLTVWQPARVVNTVRGVVRASFLEHLNEDARQPIRCRRGKTAEPSDESRLIHGSNLVQDDLPLDALE